MMGGYGGCCGLGWFGGFGSLGWIGVLLNALIVIGLILLVVWVVRRLALSASGNGVGQLRASSPTTPGDILAVRYARGEIDREQYKKMLADLD